MSDFSPRQRLHSFRHAWSGMFTLVRTQHNAWLHLIATVLVLALGIILGISRIDWALIAVAIALVWIAEALNTAIEFLADEVTEERRERIKYAKDIAAFGVVVSAITSTVVGLIVFVPYLCRLP